MSDLAAMMTKAAGWFDIGFALFHLAFWKLFRWREAAAAVGRVNAGLLQVLNVQLVLLFAGFGLLFILHAEYGFAGALGRDVLLVWTAFWVLRAALQPWFFDMAHWTSKVLVALFGIGILLHALPVFLGR